MSLFIDPRAGSADLIKPLARHDVQVEVQQLEFSDACWFGNGPDDELVGVGVELKKLNDFIQSMRDNRLNGHQLGGLLSHFQVVHIIIQGAFRIGKSGAVETRQFNHKSKKYDWASYSLGSRAVMFKEMDHFISTLQYKRGVIVSCAFDIEEAASYLVSRYHWWTDKRWDQHRSDECIYAPFSPVVGGSSAGRRASFTPRTVPKLEKMLAQLEGVDRAAYSIARKYKSMQHLMGELMDVQPALCRAADPHAVDELAEVRIEQVTGKGKRLVRLGEKKAKRIVEQLWEGELIAESSDEC